MTEVHAGLAKLREDFPDAVVGKLPRVTCKACSDKRSQCTQHQKSKCGTCQAYITSAHIHLDYVGHAETTDRLLTADPTWTWEPLGFTAEGLPLVVPSDSGSELLLWIRLTACGVTRIGLGSVPRGAFDAEKQLIGDALRNAAMRYGLALKLWAKSELESALVESPEHDAAPAPPAPQRRSGRRTSPGASPQAPAAEPEPVDAEVVEEPPAAPDGWASADEAADAHGALAARIKLLPPEDRAWCTSFREEHGWPLDRLAFENLEDAVVDFEQAAQEPLP